MKTLIILPVGVRARLDKVRDDTWGLTVLKGAVDSIKVFHIEDDGSEIEIKELEEEAK